MRWGSRVYLATLLDTWWVICLFYPVSTFQWSVHAISKWSVHFRSFRFFSVSEGDTSIALGCLILLPCFSQFQFSFRSIWCQDQSQVTWWRCERWRTPLSNWVINCDKTWQACLLGIYGYIIFEQLTLNMLLSLKFFLGSLSVLVGMFDLSKVETTFRSCRMSPPA